MRVAAAAQWRTVATMLQVAAPRSESSAAEGLPTSLETIADGRAPFLFGERVYLPYVDGKTTTCHSTSTTVEYTPDD
jgi:hypothetical protein